MRAYTIFSGFNLNLESSHTWKKTLIWRWLSSLIMLGAIAAMPTTTTAVIIYDNGGPDSLVGAFAGGGGAVFVLDDFVLDADTVISDVHWWGSCGAISDCSLDSLDYTILLFDDFLVPSSSPFAVPAAIATFAVGNPCMAIGGSTFPEFECWADIPITSLAAGTYWISIHNESSVVQWSTTTQTGGNALQGVLDTMSHTNIEMAFNITAVPEPTTLALMGLGLFGLGFNRRKRLQ